MDILGDDEADVREAERQRCQALVDGDVAAVSALVRDDLVHIHANGTIDDKAKYLEGITTRIRFEKAERGELTVRIFGDVAIATGLLDQGIVNRQTGNRVDATFATTQVWVKGSAGWSQASFHACRPQ